MKLNKKGFVSSAVLYSLLLLFLALILGLLSLLSNRKQILDKLKGDIKNEINQINIYEVYENGAAIYYNPVTGKICGDYKEENSKTGNKTGCMKWYIFNDNKNRATVDMILDHNTTATVAWNSEGTNTEMKEVKAALENDTAKWKQTARLITADEIAEITNAKTALDWTSDKTYAYPPVKGTSISYFYLDGADGADTTWQTQVANETTKSKYAWLYDYTDECTSYGCNTADSSNIGYWTSTPVVGNSSIAWLVDRLGTLSSDYVDRGSNLGVRPVITILKKDMENVQIETVYDYTGSEQQFIVPKTGNYKIELWGAQGGTTIGIDSNYQGNEGGKGGYTSGIITLEKYETLYIYVGKQGGVPTNYNDENSQGYNGGGIGGYDAGCIGAYVGLCIKEAGGGGGATDVRLKNGDWDNSESLNSRIMVAGGGGGVANWQYPKIGGTAGGLIGESGKEYNAGTSSYINATGGTQTSGGSGGNGSDVYIGSSGMFGIGGNSYSSHGGGGGGGYYGGGGGSLNSNVVGSGAGGSSYISGYIGAVAISSATDETPKSGCTDGTKDINCSYHYSGLVFKETNMIAGNESMPSHDGKTTITGNSGNGYAKITYLES